MKMPKMKLCPFCGGKPRVRFRPGVTLNLCSVECTQCKASTKSFNLDGKGFTFTPYIAVYAWNRRVNSDREGDHHVE